MPSDASSEIDAAADVRRRHVHRDHRRPDHRDRQDRLRQAHRDPPDRSAGRQRPAQSRAGRTRRRDDRGGNSDGRRALHPGHLGELHPGLPDEPHRDHQDAVPQVRDALRQDHEADRAEAESGDR